MIKRILVPIDFSASALHALDYAVEAFRQPKPEFVVVHVLEPFYFAGGAEMYGGFDMSIAYREIERAGLEQLASVQARLRRRRLVVRTQLLTGSPPHAIVECAKKLKADLIVMSTHGRTGLAHVLMGSVAEGVVRYASCPVLTVRGPAPTKRARKRPARSKK